MATTLSVTRVGVTPVSKRGWGLLDPPQVDTWWDTLCNLTVRAVCSPSRRHVLVMPAGGNDLQSGGPLILSAAAR